MNTSAARKTAQKIKEPKNLSARITWLRDYYFQGASRAWNNEFTAWTTGTSWDVQFDEMTFYIVPETYPFLQPFRISMQQNAKPVKLHPDFWSWSLPERKAWFVKEVMVKCVPQEILPGDLIAAVSIFRHPCAGTKKKQKSATDSSTARRACALR
jgi:formate C-acetyltransferase